MKALFNKGGKKSKNGDIRSASNHSPASNEINPSPPKAHNGFHTPIDSAFTSVESTRVDCCALSCCGIFQSDYNRFLLHKRRPPTFLNRLCQHGVIPLVFFWAAGYAAVFIENKQTRTFVCTALLSITVFWIVGSCLQSTYRRNKMRRDVRRRVRHGADFQSIGMDEIDLKKEDGACGVHRMCGCYQIDNVGQTNATEGSRNRSALCSRLSRAYTALCCGKLLSRQLQVLGVCALAQEARELDSMVPENERRFDYVTFQPYVEYFNEIRKLRVEKNGRLWSHFGALSDLSKGLIKILLWVTTLLLVFAVVIAPQSFELAHFYVFLCTLAQGFLVLYLVHWHWNRFDLSIDAVVKYFACGFVICTSTAVFFELAESVFMLILMKFLMFILPPVEMEDKGEYGFSFFDFSPFDVYGEASASKSYKEAFSRKYPYISVFFLFINAYIVAAMVEELCKYFGYKIVEHPDFMSEEDLQKAAAYGIPDRSQENQEDTFEFGGGLEYLGGALDGVDSDVGYYDSFDDESKEPKNGRKSNLNLSTTGTKSEQAVPNKVVEMVDCPPRKMQSIGSGITVAMVAVALGFATCENLIYIFVYSAKTLNDQIAVLIARSLFPVHPVCAAIQSIGVCKQKLENDRSIGLGNILLPAIFLHGSFDFCVMVLNFIVTLSDNDADVSTTASIVALFCSIFFVVAGIQFYVSQSARQVHRINQVDKARTFVGVQA